MTTSTILLIVVVAVVALLLIAAIAWFARNKRNQHRHAEAGKMRDRAEEESHKVGRREALADETAAKGRAAQAEAEPRPRTRKAYNTRRTHVEPTPPPLATR